MCVYVCADYKFKLSDLRRSIFTLVHFGSV